MIAQGLSDEQIQIRHTGIGASEIGAVCGVNPWQTAIDVWLRKPTPEREAIESGVNTVATSVGHAFELPISQQYATETGLTVMRPQATHRHPEHEWVLASPDGLCSDDRVLEIKVIGPYMRQAWEDGPPDYVQAQVQWQMEVEQAGFADVAAFLSPVGLDFLYALLESNVPLDVVFSASLEAGAKVELFRDIKHDADVVEMLLGAGREFWFERVLKNVPPEPTRDEDLAQYLAKRFATYRSDIIEAPGAGVYAERLVRAKAVLKAAEAEVEAAECELKKLIGSHGGVSGDWGKATWLQGRGGIAYKGVAEELAPMGVIPAALIEKHRSEPKRTFRFSPKKGG